MQRYISILIVTSIIFFCACSDDDPDIVVISPQLPKIDCTSYVKSVAADFARRGTLDSSFAKRAINKAEAECKEENKRRGY